MPSIKCNEQALKIINGIEKGRKHSKLERKIVFNPNLLADMQNDVSTFLRNIINELDIHINMDVDGELIKRQNIPLQINFHCLVDLQIIFFDPSKSKNCIFLKN